MIILTDIHFQSINKIVAPIIGHKSEMLKKSTDK